MSKTSQKHLPKNEGTEMEQLEFESLPGKEFEIDGKKRLEELEHQLGIEFLEFGKDNAFYHVGYYGKDKLYEGFMLAKKLEIILNKAHKLNIKIKLG